MANTITASTQGFSPCVNTVCPIGDADKRRELVNERQYTPRKSITYSSQMFISCISTHLSSYAKYG